MNKPAAEKLTAMDIPGLWCDDISFCPALCGWRKCPRNKKNIRDRSFPHSFFVKIPDDCPKAAHKEKKK